jgi:hypothetical protein
VRKKAGHQMARQPPEQARAQQDACDYLADDSRLTAPARDRAEQRGESDDNCDIADDISGQDIKVRFCLRAYRTPTIARASMPLSAILSWFARRVVSGFSRRLPGMITGYDAYWQYGRTGAISVRGYCSTGVIQQLNDGLPQDNCRLGVCHGTGYQPELRDS